MLAHAGGHGGPNIAAAAEADGTFNPLYDDGGEVIIQESTPKDPVSDEPITREQLLNGDEVSGLTANEHFAAPSNAEAPSEPFVGTLAFENAVMGTSPEFQLGKGELHGKDTTIFPDVAIEFFTVGTHLVPTTEDVIVNGTAPDGGRSYWDVLVQAGAVWQQPDGVDEGWNRASFPFALVNRLEGETHTGIALFLYKDDEVSDVRFQVVAQTRPGEVPDYFNAWGVTEATYTPGGIESLAAYENAYIRQMASRYPTAPLSDLEDRVDPDVLAAFDGATTDAERHSVLQTALFYDGVLYQSACETAAGPFPYCEQARHGVWSVTKSAILNVSMLRLAEKYGSDLLDEKLADYISVPEDVEGWDNVTFLDMANMASGRGATEDDPTCYLCDYQRWNLAPSRDEKVAEALDYIPVWEPGTKYVYRDQDSFLLGAALEQYLQSKEGPDATLEDMLLKEVFEPIGVYHIPANHTIEADGRNGQIKAEFGYYPTLDELTKIAMLYHEHGEWGGEQILHRDLVDSLLPKETLPEGALPKEGELNAHGQTHYAMNWHIEPYHPAAGCELHLPTMTGFGGNIVTLLPGDMVALRVANMPTDLEGAVPQAQVAEQLAPLCPN